MRCELILTVMLLVGIAGAQSNLTPHLVWRQRVSLDGNGATYRDQFSDGTIRDSVIRFQQTPVSVRLVASHDDGQAWRMDYKATFVDGTNVTVQTNSTWTLKPRNERYALAGHRLTKPPLPTDWRKTAATIASNRTQDAFAQLASRRAAVMPAPAGITNLMARPARAIEQRVEAGKLVSKMTDGSVVTNTLQKMTTARVTVAPMQPRSTSTLPEDDHTAPIAGGAAAVGAALGAAATAAAMKRRNNGGTS